MSGIRSRRRFGSTVVPNWRWEDQTIDPFELRVVGWLVSHVGYYLADHVTRNEIARQTGVSTGKVTNALNHLADLGIIEVEVGSPRHRLVITIDPDVWETPTGHEVTGDRSPDDRSTGHEVTDTQSTTDLVQQGVPPLTPPAGGEAVVPFTVPTRVGPDQVETDWFERFWVAYPRKAAKPAARKAFRAAYKKAPMREIGDGLKRWVAYWAIKSEVEFIPHASTWLNQERWNDTPPEPAGSTAPGMTALRRLATQEARRHQVGDS